MVAMLGPSYDIDDDICIPRYPKIEENLQRLLKFQPQDTDYFLCSYPKSGTHWVNEIISMLISGVAEYSTSPITNLESGNYTDSVGSKSRILHTHLPWDVLPKSIMQQKIVYVMRNPRDQIVSLYHHHQGLKRSPQMSFNEFFYSVLENPHKVEYGSWFRNAYQWWLRFRYDENVLILFYEELINDLFGQIQRIVEFYQMKDVTPEFLSKVTQKTKFMQMKCNKPVGDWFAEWHKDSFSIYRKGIIGNWRKYFTPAMNDMFQLFCSRMVQNCQYPLSYQLHSGYTSTNVISNHPDTSEVLERQQEVAMAH